MNLPANAYILWKAAYGTNIHHRAYLNPSQPYIFYVIEVFKSLSKNKGNVSRIKIF